jgi:hypothetical protein
MKALRHVLAFSTMALALALAPTDSRADADPAPAASERHVQMSGTYRFSGGAAEDGARKAAINRAIASMFFAIRPIARYRLNNATGIVPWVSFNVGDGRIRARGPEGNDLVSPDNGTPVPYVFRGEKLSVSQRLVGTTVIQRMVADEAFAQNEWSLSADGSVLRLKVTITSSHIPAPLVYSLSYARS